MRWIAICSYREIAVRKLEFSYASKTHHQGTIGLVCKLIPPLLYNSRIIGWSATSLASPSWWLGWFSNLACSQHLSHTSNKRQLKRVTTSTEYIYRK